MKKLLLTLGAVASVAAPVAAVVACGSTDGGTTPGTADGFKLATTDQANALSNLVATLSNNTDLGVDSDAHTTKIEINGDLVRFTYSSQTDDMVMPRIITVSFATKKVVKVETLLNGELKDNTASVSLTDVNADIKGEIELAVTDFNALMPVDKLSDANTEIADAISAAATEVFDTAIPANKDGLYPEIKTEAEMKRKVTLTDHGFLVTVEATLHQGNAAKDYKWYVDATTEAEAKTLAQTKADKVYNDLKAIVADPSTLSKFVVKDAVAVSAATVIYTDATVDGESFEYDAAAYAARTNGPTGMSAALWTKVKSVITKAIA